MPSRGPRSAEIVCGTTATDGIPLFVFLRVLCDLCGRKNRLWKKKRIPFCAPKEGHHREHRGHRGEWNAIGTAALSLKWSVVRLLRTASRCLSFSVSSVPSVVEKTGFGRRGTSGASPFAFCQRRPPQRTPRTPRRMECHPEGRARLKWSVVRLLRTASRCLSFSVSSVPSVVEKTGFGRRGASGASPFAFCRRRPPQRTPRRMERPFSTSSARKPHASLRPSKTKGIGL